MAKNYSWDVTINETDYHIDCQRRGTQFDFKVDGEYLYRLHANPEQIVEQNVVIGGKRCQVAVYDGIPDVIVDGIMTGVEAREEKNDRSRKIICVVGGLLLICIGLFASFSYAAMTITGTPVLGGAMAAVFGALFIIAGVVLVLSARKKKNQYGL